MKSSILITPSLLTLMLITRWFSNALPYEESLEASGQKEQHDPFPDPRGNIPWGELIRDLIKQRES